MRKPVMAATAVSSFVLAAAVAFAQAPALPSIGGGDKPAEPPAPAPAAAAASGTVQSYSTDSLGAALSAAGFTVTPVTAGDLKAFEVTGGPGPFYAWTSDCNDATQSECLSVRLISSTVTGKTDDALIRSFNEKWDYSTAVNSPDGAFIKSTYVVLGGVAPEWLGVQAKFFAQTQMTKFLEYLNSSGKAFSDGAASVSFGTSMPSMAESLDSDIAAQ
jgi:hypothetical protein